MSAFTWRLTKLAAVVPWMVASVIVAQQSANPVADPAGLPDACLRRSIAVTFIKNIQAAPPLRLQDLQVAVKGDQASIVSLVQEKLNPRVIFLLDTSASMGIGPQGSGWGIGLDAAKFAVGAIPPGGSIALGTFSEHLQLSEFQDTTGPTKPSLALGNVKPQHRTALYDAVSQASLLFKSVQFGDVIYVVTDGGDNHSSVRLPRLEDELVTRGVRVFVFLINGPYAKFLTPEEREGPVNMRELAEKTGGGFIALASKEWFTKPEAASMAKSIREQVAAPNRMELQLTSPLSKPAKLSVKFPSEPKAYTIVYPRLLEPCSMSAGQ
jgi:von Willebrand factor type A domain